MSTSSEVFTRAQFACASLATCLLWACSAHAIDEAELARCTEIREDAARLRCFDAATRSLDSRAVEKGAEPKEAIAAPAQPSPKPTEAKKPRAVRGKCELDGTALCYHWDLDHNNDENLVALLAHKPNYALVARYSDNPNVQPFSPSLGPAAAQDLDHVEAKFQLSLKVKLVEHFLWDRADLYFGYTQQSSWQVYNGPQSRPFRENDYEPEAMSVFPLDWRFEPLGFKARFANLGFVHQSNGQSGAMSRSWNRIYAQFGLDRRFGDDQLALSIRPWYRIPEHSGDDNPDINHYLGYGDLVATYLFGGGASVSMLLRNNLQTQNNRGALQVDLAYPITGLFRRMENYPPIRGQKLKVYLQLFTGYGETLIDYNHYQTTIGIGLMLSDWM